MSWGIFFSSLCSACPKMRTRYKVLLFIPFPYIPLLLLTPDLSASRPVNTTEQKCPLYSPFAWSVVTSPLHSTVLWLEILEIKRDFTCIHTALGDIDTSLSLTVQIWSCVGQVLALSKHKVKEKKKIKQGGVKRKYKKNQTNTKKGMYKGESAELSLRPSCSFSPESLSALARGRLWSCWPCPTVPPEPESSASPPAWWETVSAAGPVRTP